ncbi:MAG: hypothetical protein P4K86_01725 [Terracidiphilus sp.]|nr:hypothetical protein [Terracidiphilus sp.]
MSRSLRDITMDNATAKIIKAEGAPQSGTPSHPHVTLITLGCNHGC